MELLVADAADEVFLLDLLNTTPVVDGEVRDVLRDSTSAKDWMRDHGIAWTKTERTALAEVRSVLQAIVRGQTSASSLRPYLTGVRLRPVPGATGIDWRTEKDGESSSAVRAVLAWDALRISSPGRLRPCANAECNLFLIDRSKPNSARWCSMAICGNRMKARRHYRRAHAADD